MSPLPFAGRAPILFSLLLVIGLGACEEAAPDPSDPVVEDTTVEEIGGSDYAAARIAELGASGVSGIVTFQALGNDGVQIDYDLSGLSEGEHGFHLHENGSCEPDSTGTPGGAAGGHFNPMVSPHGPRSATPSGRHAGDLGNIRVGATADGIARGSIADSVLAFKGLTDIMGKAVILHSGADDLTTQPSGDAGSRIACGVIQPAERPVMPADTARVMTPDA